MRFEDDCSRRYYIPTEWISDPISPQLTPIPVYSGLTRDYACVTHDRWGFFPLMALAQGQVIQTNIKYNSR